ncbi:hypothetical protein LG943_20365 [Streptomonospora sp. S1-112]|uniref:Uncharacterized protein n=1 Tax=Streptomonospora mangrovi TaxID=2883123 RepID=A0A9X3NYD6_9ACTN|nr:hypothetical protein [Streptomonospora mangrovi]MDA0566646.1 hypothetical protein [Streptomonospora mangrovi]
MTAPPPAPPPPRPPDVCDPAPGEVHAAFCEVAEYYADQWLEIRRFSGADLPYLAADRPRGITVRASDLGAFAAALSAYTPWDPPLDPPSTASTASAAASCSSSSAERGWPRHESA